MNGSAKDALVFNFKNFRKSFLIIFILAVLNAILIFFLYNDHFVQSDTPSYVKTSKWLASKSDGKVYPYRLLKPVSLIIPMLFELIGISASYGLQFQNLFFYFAAIMIIAKTTFWIYKNEVQTIVASVLFMSACPVIFNGLSYLTDMGGWFFFVLIIWLFLNYLQSEIKVPRSFLFGLIIGFGLLFKENATAGLLFVFIFLFLQREISFSRRIKHFLAILVGTCLPIFISSLIVHKYTDYSFIKWYYDNWVGYFERYINFYNTLIQCFVAFTIGWIYFFRGLIFELLEKNKLRLSYFLALLPPSLLWLLFPNLSARIIFIAGPFLSIVGSYGIIHESKKLRLFSILILLFYAAFNFAVPLLFTLPKITGR